MKVAVHGKEFKRQAAPFIAHIFEILAMYRAEIIVSLTFSKFLKGTAFKKIKFKTYEQGHPFKDVGLFISIGGDGTLLESITHIGLFQTPILGINTGRLGFLATIGKEEIDHVLQNVFDGNYSLDKRTALRLHSSKEIFGKLNFALNDFTIMKKDTSSMITIHTFIDGEFLNSYWSDGIIVSTPTGSTGYSLSCGGPLIFPRSGNFVITPVSPHTLTVRPIVVSDSSEITFEIEGASGVYFLEIESTEQVLDRIRVIKN